MEGDACDELIKSVSHLIRESQQAEGVDEAVVEKAKALLASIADLAGMEGETNTEVIVEALLDKARDALQTPAVEEGDNESEESEGESEKDMAKPQ